MVQMALGRYCPTDLYFNESDIECSSVEQSKEPILVPLSWISDCLGEHCVSLMME